MIDGRVSQSDSSSSISVEQIVEEIEEEAEEMDFFDDKNHQHRGNKKHHKHHKMKPDYNDILSNEISASPALDPTRTLWVYCAVFITSLLVQRQS